MKRNAETDKIQLSLPISDVQLILNILPFGIDIVDEHLKIKYMNKLFLDIFGKDVIGKRCYEVYKDNKQQCEKYPLKSPIKIGKTKTIEISGVANGKTFMINHTGFELNGEIMIIEVFVDITERKKHIEEIEKINNIIIDRELKWPAENRIRN